MFKSGICAATALLALAGCTSNDAGSQTHTTTSGATTIAVSSTGDPFAVFCEHWAIYYNAALSRQGQTQRAAVERLRLARAEYFRPIRADVRTIQQLVVSHSPKTQRLRNLEDRVTNECAKVGYDVVRLNLADREAQPQTAAAPLRYALNMTNRGCLWAATEGAGPPQPRRDVVWPAGTTTERAKDGTVRLIAEDGTLLARVGGGLNRLRGGEQKPDAGSTTFACRLGSEDSFALYVESPD